MFGLHWGAANTYMLLRFFQSTGLKHVKPTCFGDQMNRAGHQYCLSGLLRETAKIQGGFLNSTHVQNPKWLGGWYGWLNRLQHLFEPTLRLLDPAFPKKLAARARPPRRWACSGTPGSLRLSRAGLACGVRCLGVFQKLTESLGQFS